MRFFKYLIFSIFVIFLLGWFVPQHLAMPVEGATKLDYNSNSFWFYPWGKSITHKGVDIFAKKGTTIFSATKGIVLNVGANNLGGNYVFILGPKYRLHYYAHLDSVTTKRWAIVNQKTKIGSVGNSGNAAGKQPHLHYQIKTIFPYFWRADKSPQGYKKMFYLNPIDYLHPY